ncbi:MAG: hypothetical protein JWM14_2136 [Chitinophagaceae bacterium]|nr:hypothetical protein [Chitinophagaceae bacterium]
MPVHLQAQIVSNNKINRNFNQPFDFMKAITQLGIWMDHASANLIDLAADSTEPSVIESDFTHEEKEESLHRSEQLMHNKEQQEQAAYYKELGAVIKQYDEVLLFGPTTAKTELYNLLKDDHHFADVKIECKQTDKLTQNQQHAFVKEYFAK